MKNDLFILYLFYRDFNDKAAEVEQSKLNQKIVASLMKHILVIMDKPCVDSTDLEQIRKTMDNFEKNDLRRRQ